MQVPYSPAAVIPIFADTYPATGQPYAWRLHREGVSSGDKSEDLPLPTLSDSRPRGRAQVHIGILFLYRMKPHYRSIVAIAAMAVVCFCSATALAQQPTDSLTRLLPEAHVATSRRPTEVSSAIPAQRFDSTAFRRMAITTTSDALRRMNGVNLRDYGGAGGLKTVSVRGLGAAHTTVTYDGLAVSNARQGQTDIYPEYLRHILT